MDSSSQHSSSISGRTLRRSYPREEPYAVIPLVRICAGGGQRCSFLPQPMLRDNLAGSSRRCCWGAEVRLSRSSQNRHRIGRPSCLENPKPAGAEYSLTESATSPFHAEPEHRDKQTGSGRGERSGYKRGAEISAQEC